jgi:uncharacterized protein (DUF3084 family)
MERKVLKKAVVVTVVAWTIFSAKCLAVVVVVNNKKALRK